MEDRKSNVEKMGINSNFWKEKKVFLTGHTGFKGGWLSLWLQNLGSILTGYSNNIPTEPSFYKSSKVEENMESVFGDVRNKDYLFDTMKKSNPDIVIHMAAQTLVRKSYDDPLETYETNVMGTVNLLESVRKIHPKVVIVVTSDKCYDNKESKKKFQEDDPMGGYDPYSNSKGCAELVVSSYRNSFFNIEKFQDHKVSLASVRAGNVIGGGDWSQDRLIPDIMSSIYNQKPLSIRNPESVRPWQFILDPLCGYLILAEKMWENGKEFSEAWNFGPNDENLKTVSWIVNKIDPKLVNTLNSNTQEPIKHESEYLALDSSKASTKLGWNLKIDINLALDWTMAWYEKFVNNDNMNEFSTKQIQNYQSLN